MDTKVAGYAERPWHMLIGGDLVTGRTGTTMPVIHPGDESMSPGSHTQHKNVYIKF